MSQVGTLSEEEIVRRIRMQSVPPLDDPALEFQQIDASLPLRPSAVLVPLVWMEDGWHLLFTRRTEWLQSHKGQVSFPGGGAEPEDRSPEATALREVQEEIGIKPEDVRVFGRLISRPTVTHFIITPIVGRIRWPKEFVLSTQEVSRVFTIPLAWLADPVNREERPRSLPNGYHENVIFYQPYDGEVLWGASARITIDLLHILE